MAKTGELRQKSLEELNAVLKQKQKLLRELRFTQVGGKLKNPRLLGRARKDVARIRTLLQEHSARAS